MKAFSSIKFCILVIFSLLFFGGIVNAKTYEAVEINAKLYEIKDDYLDYTTTNFSNNYWSGYIPYIDKDTVIGWKIILPDSLVRGHVYYIRINSGNEGAGDGKSFSRMQNIYFTELSRQIDYSSAGTILCFTIQVIKDMDVIFVPFSLTLDGNNIRFVLDKIEITDLNVAWNKHIYYGKSYFNFNDNRMLI